MRVLSRSFAFAWAVVMLGTAVAHAQVQTGSITGTVSDSSNAVLPGATVVLSGERIIGGTAIQVTDAGGT